MTTTTSRRYGTPSQRRFLFSLSIVGLSLCQSGCAVATVASAAAGAAISVTGAVVGAGVSVAGKVVEKTVDIVTPSKN